MLDGGGGGGLVGPDFNLHSTITENMPPSLLANLNIPRTFSGCMHIMHYWEYSLTESNVMIFLSYH